VLPTSAPPTRASVTRFGSRFPGFFFFLFFDLTVKGFWLVKWFRTASRESQRALYAELTALIADGSLHAPVHATYPIAQIQEAVAAANAGARSGKILVTGDAP
jgi:NADPH:quinone reductase-like Zn-dependent oxidoreductase